MDWAMLGLMLGLIGIVAGAAWRFGKVEKGIANLEEADEQIKADIRALDQRLSADIREVRKDVRDVRQEVSDVRQDVREVRRDVQRILERLAPPAA
ncbi:MAG: hypothetical protein OXG17_09485 [Chloroflexi bacterium]|nr:hypothetical protein [Chloroflexota bacterium]